MWQCGQSHRLHRVPRGHVALITPWNYPLQILGIQLVQAIVAGNTVVVKPSERCPQSQQKLLEIARDAGLPHERLSWTPATRGAGAHLLQNEHFDHVVFTGSTAVGRDIAQHLAGSMTPSTLELSGSDSALVLADATPALAAAAIGYASAINAGSTCMAPRRALVTSSVRAAFIAELTRAISTNPPLDRYSQADHAGSMRAARQAVEHGGHWLDPAMDQDRYPSLRVVLDAPADGPLARGEHFGPALAVISCPDDQTVVSAHLACDQHLATSVFTTRRNWINTPAGSAVLRHAGGMVTLNDCLIPAAHPAAPLTGRGPSGWGASGGAEGLRSMTRPVVVSSTSRWLRTPLAPPSLRMQKVLGQFIARWYG